MTTKIKKPKAPLSARQFKKLPIAKRAVLLAKDVLQQIRLHKLIVETGNYVYTGRPQSIAVCDLSLGTAAGKKAVGDAQCHVCAKGALFVANALRTNSCSVGDVLNVAAGSGYTEPLLTERLVDDNDTASFDTKSWHLMEAAFERDSCFGHEAGLSWEATEAAAAFGDEHQDDERRLVAIMLNVIKNKGKFVPTKTISDDEVFALMERWDAADRKKAKKAKK
jgi:hypothetical protein